MRYRLVIFDFDGTLADSWPWFMAVFDDVAVRFGLARVAPEEVPVLRGLSARAIMARMRIPRWKMPLLALHMRRRMAADIDTIRVFDGVAPMLRTLAAEGVAIAVVSSNAEANVRRVLGPELSALVRVWGCGASTFGKHRKFRAIMRRLGVPAAATLTIGDELRDQEAARRAGIAFGASTWGYTTPEALRAAGPDLVFAGVEAIADAVLGR